MVRVSVSLKVNFNVKRRVKFKVCFGLGVRDGVSFRVRV